MSYYSKTIDLRPLACRNSSSTASQRHIGMLGNAGNVSEFSWSTRWLVASSITRGPSHFLMQSLTSIGGCVCLSVRSSNCPSEVLSVTLTVSSKSKGNITRTNMQRIRSDWRTLFILFLSALRLILAAWSNLLLAFWSRCGTVKRSRDCFDCSANFFEGQPCFVMLFFFLAIAFFAA